MQAPFDKYLSALATMLCGLAVGFAITASTLGSGYGFGAYHVGPWTAWPRVGGPDSDPYSRAALARRGEAPLGRDEGLMFVANLDSHGNPLDGQCEYRVTNSSTAARFWTLSLANATGAPLVNSVGRYFYTSSDVLRREGGAFDIVVSRRARPGNWLSPAEAGTFVLVLRLYEESIDTSARLDASHLPSIMRLGCG